MSAGFEYISGILPKIMEKILAPFEAVKNGIAKVKSFLFGDDEENKLEFNKTTTYKPVTSTVVNPIPVQNTPNVAGYYEKGGLVQQHSINNRLNASITYAPNITVQGNTNKQDILKAEKMSQREFEKMYKQQRYNDARLSLNGGY